HRNAQLYDGLHHRSPRQTSQAQPGALLLCRELKLCRGVKLCRSGTTASLKSSFSAIPWRRVHRMTHWLRDAYVAAEIRAEGPRSRSRFDQEASSYEAPRLSQQDCYQWIERVLPPNSLFGRANQLR